MPLSSPLLFLDHRDAASVIAELETARVQMKRAIRYLTKTESDTGRRAHGDAHDSLKSIERAIALLKK